MTELLVVVDSKTKADFMKEYFANRAECVICTGPLFTMSQQLSPGTASGFIFHLEGLPSSQHCLAALHNFQNKEILLALDSDTLADFLCWQISSYLSQIGGKAGVVKRLAVHAFTKENMAQALHSASTLDALHGLAYYSRQLFDSCLARHLTKLIGTDHGPGNLPLQKNSLTALFLLAERQQERSQALLNPRWQIQATITTHGENVTVMLGKEASLASDTLLIDEAKAHALRDQLAQTPLEITAKSQSPLRIPAPAPYQIAELLHDAVHLLGLQPRQTLAIVKKLFHGVALSGQIHGLISSPYPGAEPLSKNMLATLRQQVTTLYGPEAISHCDTPTLGMIIPIRPELDGADLNASLSHDEAALYELIRRRALASQMHPALGSTTTIEFLAGKETILHAHLHELSDPGFLQATPAEVSTMQTLIPVAELVTGQEFVPIEVTCTPLAEGSEENTPYTCMTLLADLSDFSIASDFATITMLDQLITAGYATLSAEGYLQAAENTLKVVNILDRAFPRMQRVNLAAYIEQTINEATSARKDLPFALTQFDQTLTLHGQILLKTKTSPKMQPRARTSSTIIKQTAPAFNTSAPSPPEKNSAISLTNNEISPPVAVEQDVSSQISAETERNKIAISPEFVPAEIRLNTEIPEPEIATQAVAGTEAQGEDEEQSDIFANEDLQQTFAEALSGASSPAGSPEKTTTEAPPATSDAPRSDSTIACPLCGHAVIPEQTPTGKRFYACRYENCQFMSWSVPHDLPCGLCDSPYLVEKTIHGVPLLRCPRAGCTYEQPLSDENLPPSSTASSPPKKMVRRLAPGSAPGASTKKVRIVRRRA